MYKIYGELALLSGSANPALAQELSDHLQTPLTGVDIIDFPNENIFIRLRTSVRAKDVFIIQPTSSPVNRNIMELLIMIDTVKRASAGRITAVIPYYAYGRTDKKDQPRVPITARLIADMIQVAGADRVLTMDLHAGQIQGFFSIPVDEITAFDILVKHFIENPVKNAVVVAPDVGATKRARNFAEVLNAPLAVIEKRRIGNADRSTALNVIGDVQGKNIIIFDDEVDTASSLMEAAHILTEHGAEDIYACVTHGVLSGPAVSRIAASNIKELVITNTVPLPPEKRLAKIRVLSIASVLGDVIRAIHEGTSVGAAMLRYRDYARERSDSGAV
ncbi:MAG: ribose-phosphate pyrophosphokinase [Chloroflexi bacterium]|nr:ribose-phosphate pyrophosphokinase [Chloroflexota bacterium]